MMEKMADKIEGEADKESLRSVVMVQGRAVDTWPTALVKGP